MQKKKQKTKINGWLSVDKPYGVSSNDVLFVLKKALSPMKIGHAGTLDPLATGVLPIAFGEATKTVQYLQETPKAYEFEVTFGHTTTTDDAEGEVLETTNKLPSKEDLQNVTPEFLGKIEQIPPKYSALKIDGQRAYKLAREGKEFEMKSREVEVYNLELLSVNEEGGKVKSAKFLCECSKGTYIRTIAKDVAEKVGSLGFTSLLDRVSYGSFLKENSLSLDESLLRKDQNPENQQERLQLLKSESIISLKSVDAGLGDIPVLQLEDRFCSLLRNGVAVKDLESLPSLEDQKIYSVYSKSSPEKISALSKFQSDCLKAIKVFNL